MYLGFKSQKQLGFISENGHLCIRGMRDEGTSQDHSIAGLLCFLLQLKNLFFRFSSQLRTLIDFFVFNIKLKTPFKSFVRNIIVYLRMKINNGVSIKNQIVYILLRKNIKKSRI